MGARHHRQLLTPWDYAVGPSVTDSSLASSAPSATSCTRTPRLERGIFHRVLRTSGEDDDGGLWPRQDFLPRRTQTVHRASKQAPRKALPNCSASWTRSKRIMHYMPSVLPPCGWRPSRQRAVRPCWQSESLQPACRWHWHCQWQNLRQSQRQDSTHAPHLDHHPSANELCLHSCASYAAENVVVYSAGEHQH